ncbi:helix-turn-helix domain-containing protein [Flavobacterium olei]|uniref:helix-turn-helix domain-containing protein n=1 Tax=Flavobacterium olei TaxID=1886782 RepID=UPI00321B53BC
MAICCPDPEFLTILQASKLVDLSVATIYSKVCRNEIPVNKHGKKLYFIKSELLDWIKSAGLERFVRYNGNRAKIVGIEYR